MLLGNRFFRTLFAFCMICSSITAKDCFVPGKIITNTNDTVIGWICMRDNVELATRCLFKTTLGGTPIKYGPKELNGYQFDNEHRVFHTRSVLNMGKLEEVFMETIVSGSLELLCWVDIYAGDVLYLSRKGDETLIDLPFEQKEVWKDDGYTRKRMTVTSTMHQDTLRKYMVDRPDLFGQINRMIKPRLVALTTLVTMYNNLPSTTLEVERKLKSAYPFVFHLMPGVATSDYKLLGPLIYDWYAGGTMSLHLFGRYDQIQLTAGVYKKMIEGNPVFREYHAMVRVPMGLDYCFRGKYVNPFVGVGFDGYFDRMGSNWVFAPSLGLKLIPFKKIALVYRCTFDLDVPNWDFNKGVYKYTAHAAGIEIRF